ncbi:hypothetical protein A4A49_55005 [Nicotiana attenuata]|uniref:Uncharacterized protein n=1 Tax=Nicotiana attenuata TaxID=49451 RepID=A0A1J6JSB6_NICAT|nr:hypothetical protein A4A49_55005 [Nicotiana attenuata]
MVHMWAGFDSKLMLFRNICQEFTSKLGFSGVKQLLVTCPSSRYYIVENDDDIRALQCLLCQKFKEIHFFAVDKFDLTVHALDIKYHTKTYGVDVEVVSDCEHSIGSYDFSESDHDYDCEYLESINMQKKRVVIDSLDNFKELELGMTFKGMQELGMTFKDYFEPKPQL